MFAGVKLHKLESKTFVDGGNVQVAVRGLPPNRCLKGFLVVLDTVFNTGGAAAAIASNVLPRLVKQVTLGDRIKMSGMGLAALDWLMQGVDYSLTYGVPATNSSAFRRKIKLYVPYEDPAARFPGDCQTAPEFLDQTPLAIDFNTSTALWTSLSSVTGTVTVYAVHEPLQFGRVPGILQLAQFDPNVQHIEVPGGEQLITHAWLFKETGATIDSGEIAGVQMTCDGEMINNLPARIEDLAAYFDWARAGGGSVEALSATAPVQGEQLPDEPGSGAAAAATVSLPLVPLVIPGGSYLLSDVLHVTKSLIVDLTGSMTNGFTLATRSVLPRTDAQEMRAKAVLGIADNAKRNTATGNGLSNDKPRLNRFLPSQYA